MSVLSNAIGIDINALKWFNTQILGTKLGGEMYQLESNVLKGQTLTQAAYADALPILTSYLGADFAKIILGALQSGKTGAEFWLIIAKGAADVALVNNPALRNDVDVVVTSIESALGVTPI